MIPLKMVYVLMSMQTAEYHRSGIKRQYVFAETAVTVFVQYRLKNVQTTFLHAYQTTIIILLSEAAGLNLI